MVKAQWDESGGRILLGDNTGGEAVMLRPIRFQCVGAWISAGLPGMCTYSWPYSYLLKIRLEPDLLECRYPVRKCSAVPARNDGSGDHVGIIYDVEDILLEAYSVLYWSYGLSCVIVISVECTNRSAVPARQLFLASPRSNGLGSCPLGTGGLLSGEKDDCIVKSVAVY
jgi:hypothetical protein